MRPLSPNAQKQEKTLRLLDTSLSLIMMDSTKDPNLVIAWNLVFARPRSL
jgi:hypothetical protein